MKTFSEMTDSEKEKFECEFYDLWENEFQFHDDRDSDNPFLWGCPWDWCGDSEFIPADQFFYENKKEIEDLNATE